MGGFRLATAAVLLGATPALGFHTLGQQRNLNTLPLCTGASCLTTEGPAVELNANPYECTQNGTLKLEFELLPTGQAFAGVATYSSPSIPRPNCTEPFPWTRVTGLTSGTQYKWQWRTAPSAGSPGAWNQFNLGLTAFTAGPALSSQLAIKSLAQPVTAGTCSQPVTFETQTSAGAPAPVPTSTTFSLYPSQGVTFFSDPGCALATTTVTVPAGSSSASFYWSATRAQIFTLAIDEPTFIAASQVQTVIAAAPAKLAIEGYGTQAAISDCSAELRARTQDAYGNPSKVAASTTVTLLTNSAGLKFSTSTNCGGSRTSIVIAAGTDSEPFRWLDTQPGWPTVSVSAPNLTGASLNLKAYVRLVFTNNAVTTSVNVCSPTLTVQTQDGTGKAYGVPAPTDLAVGLGRSIYLRDDAGFYYRAFERSDAGAFYSDSTCSTPVTATVLPNGGSSYSGFFKTVRTYDRMVFAQVVDAGVPFLEAIQYETVNPGPPAALAFSTAPQFISAGACSGYTQLRSQDTYGNPSPVSAATPLLLSTTSDGGSFYSAAGCATQVTSTTIGVNLSYHYCVGNRGV